MPIGDSAWKVVMPEWSDIMARNSAIAARPWRTSPTTRRSGAMRIASSTPSATLKECMFVFSATWRASIV